MFVLGRFCPELAIAKQRCWHLLHPHWRPWSVDGRRRIRISMQVAFRRLPTAGITHRLNQSINLIF